MSEKHAQDTLSLIGSLLPGWAKRDAVHVAVLPVIAAETLSPSDRVVIELKDGVYYASYAIDQHKAVGIVDPYFNGMVIAEQRVFVFLMPKSVTSLRHAWTANGVNDE